MFLIKIFLSFCIFIFMGSISTSKSAEVCGLICTFLILYIWFYWETPAWYIKKLNKRADKLINEHEETLIKKYKQLTYTDDYGKINKTAFKNECGYFIKNIIFTDETIQKLMSNAKLKKDALDIMEIELTKDIEQRIKRKNITVNNTQSSYTNPYDFEQNCANILKEQGWNARATQKSGDQGVDVVANKNGITIVFQCKLYSSAVGNAAVQEIFSGKAFYDAQYAAVVSNNNYTKSARLLAKNCGVLLLNTEDLYKIDSFLK